MNNNTNQKHEQNDSSKQVWIAPVLEACDIDQTMVSTGSNADGTTTTA